MMDRMVGHLLRELRQMRMGDVREMEM